MRAILTSSFCLMGLGLTALSPRLADAFFEDVCVAKKGGLEDCVQASSACRLKPSPDSSCPAQLVQAARPSPGRSMIHADATYFIAQALGFRADVAYWIVAYNEVTDLTRYAPIDQCGIQATATNSGSRFITATFNGFQRTNLKTDGPLYHYTLSFSPNGDGTDVHGAGGVQAVYPWHYPAPGYPTAIDDVYQGTLYNLRQWAMQTGTGPGLLCAAGLTVPRGASNFSGASCLMGVPIRGVVKFFMDWNAGAKIESTTGPKLLDNSQAAVTYDQLEAWLKDKNRTAGTLWKDAASTSVPVQIARIGIYLHSLQDTASHSTYCGDDAPSPPGGNDTGTYMALSHAGVRLVFGNSCAARPHVAGHVQETGTADAPLPLRDYTALNITLDELIIFGNTVARQNGWLANPGLLPPDVIGGRNARGQSAADLKAQLIGALVKGQAFTRGESYRSGVATLPLQQAKAMDRIRAMNSAILAYSDALKKQSTAAPFSALELMPGNASDPNDRSACFK